MDPSIHFDLPSCDSAEDLADTEEDLKNVPECNFSFCTTQPPLAPTPAGFVLGVVFIVRIGCYLFLHYLNRALAANCLRSLDPSLCERRGDFIDIIDAD